MDDPINFTYDGTIDLESMTASTNPSPQPKYPRLVAFSLRYMDVHGYIAVVVCFWGVIANVANIVVLTRKNMTSCTNLILTWLAVADLLTMLSCLPINIHFYIMKDPTLPFPSTRSSTWIRIMLFHVNFSVVCHTIAIWLTIMLAIFRFLYICCPSRGSQLCSMFRTKIGIAVIYVATAAICIPNYLVNTIKKTPYPGNGTGGNKTEYYFAFAQSDISEPLLQKINFWIQALLIKLIPCLLLTILTIFLIYAMHDAHKRRMRLKSQGRKDESERAHEHNRTTAMLLAVVGLLLLTELPQGVLTLCSIFIEDFFLDVYWQLGDLLDIMALLNNSINFVLYCSMSRQFRDTFVKVFCDWSRDSHPGWLKVKTNSSTVNGASQATNV